MKSRQGGFTLLEILIALSILATAVTIIFQLFSASLRNIAVSADYVSGVIKAETKMREVLSEEDLAEEAWTESEEDGYTYAVTIKKTLEIKTDAIPVQMMQIDLVVTWTKGAKARTIRLRTMKMIGKQV